MEKTFNLSLNSTFTFFLLFFFFCLPIEFWQKHSLVPRYYCYFNCSGNESTNLIFSLLLFHRPYSVLHQKAQRQIKQCTNKNSWGEIIYHSEKGNDHMVPIYLKNSVIASGYLTFHSVQYIKGWCAKIVLKALSIHLSLHRDLRLNVLTFHNLLP